MKFIKIVCVQMIKSRLLYFHLYFKIVHYDVCLRNRLDQFSHDQAQMNTLINHEPVQYGEIASLPFTGENLSQSNS